MTTIFSVANLQYVRHDCRSLFMEMLQGLKLCSKWSPYRGLLPKATFPHNLQLVYRFKDKMLFKSTNIWVCRLSDFLGTDFCFLAVVKLFILGPISGKSHSRGWQLQMFCSRQIEHEDSRVSCKRITFSLDLNALYWWLDGIKFLIYISICNFIILYWINTLVQSIDLGFYLFHIVAGILTDFMIKVFSLHRITSYRCF